jgi:hypothetical protein
MWTGGGERDNIPEENSQDARQPCCGLCPLVTYRNFCVKMSTMWIVGGEINAGRNPQDKNPSPDSKF